MRGNVGAGLRLRDRDRRDHAALGDDRQIFGRCSSEPKCSSGMMNMVLSAAIDAQAGETFEISSRAMQAMVRLPFGPS